MDSAELRKKLEMLRQAVAEGDPDRLFISVPKKTICAMLDRIVLLEQRLRLASNSEDIP